ncbi:MAG: hypothetical protein KDE19_16805, partial [Caldilineaceae bacterium]|nr:hypothetical protein [Caldilineaceae bacterium]
TICGPGGAGKSSLALTFGQRLLNTDPSPFPDGVFFVPLSALESNAKTGQSAADDGRASDIIITAIAEAVGCQFFTSQPLALQLRDYLQHRRLLLILDNFEQLVQSAGTVVNLLEHVPGATVLVTSRACLNTRGEAKLILRGLSLSLPVQGPSRRTLHDTQDAEVQMSEAIALFVDRVQNLNPNFILDAETIVPVTQICQAVVGLPLAIEMAAAWIDVYSCAEIAERFLGDRQEMALLTSQFHDQSERHQSLQKVFDDSWSLLPTRAQWALAKVSVFGGQFTRVAAEAVAALTVADLIHLRDHSLLQVDGEYRYSLHPLIRQFAAENWQKLTAQQPQVQAHLRNAHSAYYLQRIADLAQHPNDEAEYTTIHTLKKDHAEIVRSWQWAVQQRYLPQIQGTMAGLFRYLELTSQSTEGKLLFGLANADTHEPVLQWLQVAQCHFMRRLAEYDAARQRLEALIAVISPLFAAGKTATEEDAAETVNLARQTYTFALCVLGWVNYEQGDYVSAQHCFATARAQAETVGNRSYLFEAHNGLGAVAFSQKKYESAHMYYEIALMYAQQQADLHHTAIILGNLAAHAQVTNAFSEAERYLQMRLEIDLKTQNIRQMAISYQRLGQLALIGETYSKAESHLRNSLALFEQLGNCPETAHALLDLSQSLLYQQRVEEAEEQCLRSLQFAIQARMTPRILAALTYLAEIWIAEEKKEDAILLLQMVNRSAQIPAATWRRAKNLQESLTAELGEKAVGAIRQALPGQSLQEFGAHLLMRGRVALTPTEIPMMH